MLFRSDIITAVFKQGDNGQEFVHCDTEVEGTDFGDEFDHKLVCQDCDSSWETLDDIYNAGHFQKYEVNHYKVITDFTRKFPEVKFECTIDDMGNVVIVVYDNYSIADINDYLDTLVLTWRYHPKGVSSHMPVIPEFYNEDGELKTVLYEIYIEEVNDV